MSASSLKNSLVEQCVACKLVESCRRAKRPPQIMRDSPLISMLSMEVDASLASLASSHNSDPMNSKIMDSVFRISVLSIDTASDSPTQNYKNQLQVEGDSDMEMAQIIRQ